MSFRFPITLIVCLWSFAAFSQVQLDSALFRKYPFLKPDSSYIHNADALNGFFEKLFLLETTGQGLVDVVHIGDSHIQADFFSGVIRIGLQGRFGNAGRGLIFPYRLAKSNEPSDYRTSSLVKWDYRRNVFADKPIPIGIGGYTIKTFDSTAAISVTVKQTDTIDYSVTKLTLFHAKTEDQFDFAVYDSLGNEIGYINTTSLGSSPFTSVFRFPRPMTKFVIKPCPRNFSQNCAQIYGILLENERHGLRYDMIGVNGAEYRHYNQSEYFIEQLQYLAPDLVILSMGTNEAFNYRGFNEADFYNQVDSLVKSLKKTNPGVTIMITTPGDSYKRAGRKGRVKNPVVPEMVNTLVRYANDNHIAYWDLFQVSGGWGSMSKWYSAGMADKFRIHYSKKGYEIQGKLLLKALTESYDKYKTQK